MKSVSVRVVARITCVASFLFVLALGPSALHSSVQADSKRSYFFKVSSTRAASQLIESIGGNVFESIESLNYIGAELTSEQLQLVSRSALVLRISLTVDIAAFESASGDLSEFQTELGEELVAGKLWGRKFSGKA